MEQNPIMFVVDDRTKPSSMCVVVTTRQHRYQEVDLALVGKMLGGLDGAALAAFAAARGWRVEGVQVFVTKQDELVQSKNIVESLNFASLAPLMAFANTTARK